MARPSQPRIFGWGHLGDARSSEQRMCPQHVPIVSYAPTAQFKSGLFWSDNSQSKEQNWWSPKRLRASVT